MREQFSCEEGYRITCYHNFKFDNDEGDLHINVGQPGELKEDQCIIALEPAYPKVTVPAPADIVTVSFLTYALQIKANDINFWSRRLDDLKLRHQTGLYPPRVKVSISLKSPDHFFKLPFKFTGCSSDHTLDMELNFPLGN